MSLIKLGEANIISSADIKSPETVMADPQILAHFEKVASDLKKIAPKAKDFLYFTAIMMHAAEAALLDERGQIRKDAHGQDVTAHWESKGDSVTWRCSDPSIKPYRNRNLDIFSEPELLKAHKKWVGKPLCMDHQSSAVDMIRGVIVDTYYDYPNKRVVALCALDKVNYPEVARKVSTGYATSVSMGTAVGKAICYDCGNVARVESDFCDHMKNKSCYGEINMDLNPIELSIVVNGADPKAKIRHIVAQADHIARYIEMKQEQLTKSAEAVVVDETPHIEMATEIGEGLDGVVKKLEDLKKEVDALRRGEEAENNHEHQKAPESEASKEAASKDMVLTLRAMQQDLTSLRLDLNKLSKDSTFMTGKKAYYQGAGGVNEPAPHTVKYPKEDSDKIRDTQDTQMTGLYDLGGTDGMAPGDEQTKKELQRLAEQKERALRRQAALDKVKKGLETKSYYQGGGGVNEPTPNKPKYPKEEADKIRDTEDRQQTGESPFPGVGKIDGLYGDDLKKKEMLSRAKLTAKFVRVANIDGSENLGDSCWQIFADKRLVLSASVNQLSGGKAQEFYSTIHTNDFAKKIMARVRSEGFEKAAGYFKGAQAALPAASTPSVTSAPPVSDMSPPSEKPAQDAGGAGDPKDELPKLVDELGNLQSELAQGVEALTGDTGNNLADFDELKTPEGGMVVPAQAIVMQEKLSKGLIVGFKQAQKEVGKHLKELVLAQELYDNRSQIGRADAQFLNSLVHEAMDDAKVVQAHCDQLKHSFVNYAKATKIFMKRATSTMAQNTKLGQALPPAALKQNLPGDPLNPDLGLGPAAKPSFKSAPKVAPTKPKVTLDPRLDPKSNLPPLPYPGHEHAEEMLLNMTGNNPSGPGQTPSAPSPSGQSNPTAQDLGHAKDEDCNDAVKLDSEGNMTAETPEDAGKAMKAMKAAGLNLKTREGRDQLRAKLAEKGMKFSDMLDQAHKGGVTLEGVKATGDLAKFETTKEQHEAMEASFTAAPKVKKQAEDIQRLVALGKINPETDFPMLVSKGLDAEAVKYWKGLFGQMKDGGSQFASDLIKDVKGKKEAAEKETYRVKIARAYELAHEMSRKGMIGEDRHAVSTQVNEIMSFNDEGFDSMKRFVERAGMQKKASMPQVGIDGGGEIYVPTPGAGPQTLVADYEKLFANRRF